MSAGVLHILCLGYPMSLQRVCVPVLRWRCAAVAVWSSVCDVCDTCVAIKGACVFMLLSLLGPAFHRVETKCY